MAEETEMIKVRYTEGVTVSTPFGIVELGTELELPAAIARQLLKTSAYEKVQLPKKEEK